MKPSSRRADKKTEREHSKDDLVPKKQEERSKKSIYSVTTPKNFMQKSSTADIYARKDAVKAPRKIAASKNSDVSPMKGLLRSSPSSVSQITTRSKTKTPTIVKAPVSARFITKSGNVSNKLPSTNVTVNSPIAKRKLNLENEKASVKTETKTIKRERTNTRTLDEEEIKVLTSEIVDNNSEILKLSKKLSAQPKAFFVDLDERKRKDKSSDEDVSYEDDFESYESDFDSYHSESIGVSPDDSNGSDCDDGADAGNQENDETNSKEESKLDSGNFDLPERPKTKPMEFIDEGPEADKKVSLDEGFLDMSSGLSSMKTLHIDVLDRPLFIDFTKSKADRKKRKIFESLKRRANDILSMVTLHEMSYSLFEMIPIPYEVYMATFGRLNHTQTAAQTFDDGITEEVQTEEILCDTKWTQHPVEFSNEIIHVNKYDLNSNKHNCVDKEMNASNINDSYMRNPLRVYFEQRDGAGSDTVLPYDKYKEKLKNNTYNVIRLRKFVKRVESRISNILSVNAGNTNMSNLIKTSKFPFSTGYVSMTTKNLNEKSFLKNSEITGVVFSENKSNLIITIHKKFSEGVLKNKCALCLWDLSVARVEPLKCLMATDNVKIGKYRGSTDGYVVGALEDGSINLWDLSEEPLWCNDTYSIDAVEEDRSNSTECEADRDWNLRSRSYYEQQHQYILQASAYTSCGINIVDNVTIDCIVGLEFTNYTGPDGSHVVGQICSLQRIGILTMWLIVKKKSLAEDIGKALWSKMKLKKNQTIDLSDHLEVNSLKMEYSNFNLNAAKKRLAAKRLERNLLKRQNSRPKPSSKFENDRYSVAINKIESNLWENGIVCSDLKILHLKVDNYLVGKNLGEVLCCRKNLSSVKVTRFSVASSSSSVTCLQTSNLPYFLAATDTGTINLCSLIDYRVLLTLDCRNSVPAPIDKCYSDHKGRFVGSSVRVEESSDDGQPISSIYWSHTNPLRIVCVQKRVCVWSLAQSDVNAVCADRALCCVGNDRALAILTPEEVQVYELNDDLPENIQLFNKYVTLL